MTTMLWPLVAGAALYLGVACDLPAPLGVVAWLAVVASCGLWCHSEADNA